MFDNTSGLQTEDHRDFAGVQSLDVFTEMNLNGGDPADQSLNTEITFLVESFSQQQVPEPGALALLGLGFVAMVRFTARAAARC